MHCAAISMCLLLLAGNISCAHAEEGLNLSGEDRFGLLPRQANTRGPLAAALALQPSLAKPPQDSAQLALELRGRWQQWVADVWMASERPRGGPSRTEAHVNELNLSGELAGWQWSTGKKIVSWDVGYAYRPNDVVQQEARRSLLDNTTEGKPLLQLERFGAEDALSLVLVHPQRLGNDGLEGARFDREPALAARAYQRFGALDAYGFARWGRHTGASLGMALAWVAGDEWELHASLRALQRHDGWQAAPGRAGTPLAANPWQVQTQGRASQVLLGLNWTGAQRQGLLFEAWHDGSAPSAGQWRDWTARNSALIGQGRQPGLPASLQSAVAGNLAWQTSPMAGPGLQRDNLFLRLSWQPEPWQLTLDGLYQPADHGRIWTAGLQWQGDRWRLNASWRVQAGPARSVLAQLPTQRSGVLAATRAF